MTKIKSILFLILIGNQIVFYTAEEIKKATDVKTPSNTQDSYLAAYADTKKGSVKSDRSSVTYVTAANQDNKGVLSFNKANQPLTNIAQPINKAAAGYSLQPTQSTAVRREDNDYPTGPYAEPNLNYNGYDPNSYNAISPGYDNSYSDSYFPQNNKFKYGVPSYHHNQVKPSYGPPEYAHPTGSYGYGPTAPTYGPPMRPVYGVPYGLPSFFDKIKLKLDIFTLGKIILKLIIFKKIVKFIAVICLLLFLPKLIHVKKDGKDDDYDDEDRKLQYNAKGRTNESVNTLYAFVQHAIDTYTQQQKGCEDVGCRMKNVLDNVDEEYSFSSMTDMFKESNS